MKLPDTNVWLALALSGHHFHAAVSEWLEGEQLAGSLLFCRSTQQSFLRLLTTAAILNPFGNPPLSNTEAWTVYQGLLADPRMVFAQEPDDLEVSWQRLAERDTASPKIWMDAYLAAFAIGGGHQLVTIDAGFTQYGGLDMLLLTP
ncbi:MAG TPA: TA system VapC family ribonuclease toxin [Armatimonadota bacterium]|nr:TA system VapC family ribonuclease toxin [Armatimonadota bacterium]